MSKFNFQQRETLLLHGGQTADPTTGSRAVPIYQTTSYVFKDTEHAQNLFGLKEPGNIYTRIMNPTVDAFEQRVALLEDGAAAVATSSGMAAITLAILNIAGTGDEIIADSNLYGGTYNLFAHTLPRYGINVKFVDGKDLNAIEAAINDKTKAIFGEIITNPSLNVFDVEAVAEVAHRNGIPLIIDNTFATPYITQPIQWGADIVIHSATKWIGGHGTAIGGIVVDGGRFDWSNGKFPGFTEPDESYGGLRYVDVGAPAFAVKLRVQLLRDIGACLSPNNAFLLLQGLETLHLRIVRHNDNTEKVADYLTKHPAIEWVNYPGLADHPSHALAKKYFKSGYGSVITFGITGGREAGRTLIDNISLLSHVANVGDAKSLIIHPASTTHQQLNAEGLEKSGVTEELVRLAIGLETIDDILQDLDQAIAIATNTQATLQDNDERAIKWLLNSPYDREDGNFRQKTIAIIGLEQDEILEEAKKLKKYGYKIFPIGSTNEALFGKEVYKDLEDVPESIDAVYINTDVTQELVEQLIIKTTKIIWTSKAEADSGLIEAAHAAGTIIVAGNSPSEAYSRLRNNRK